MSMKIDDVTRLVVCNCLTGLALIVMIILGFILAALGGATGCSHIPTLPDLPGTTTTTTTTTTTQPPAASDDAVPMASLTWNRGGINHSRAQRDPRVTITSARVSGSTFHYAGSGLATWPLRSFNPGGNINAVFIIFFDGDKDGTYERGGKIDWARFNAAPRPMGTHLDGYSNWDGHPASGTPWAALITSEDGCHRSNIVKGIWP